MGKLVQDNNKTRFFIIILGVIFLCLSLFNLILWYASKPVRDAGACTVCATANPELAPCLEGMTSTFKPGPFTIYIDNLTYYEDT